MRYLTCALSLIVALVFSYAPSAAAPTIIVQLGSAPLLGRSDSTQELRLKVIRNDERLATAATMLGLSPDEYKAFRASLAAKTPGWGVLPRHMSAMAFYRPGGVHVLHDVIIPAHTFGWEVDVEESDQTVRVLIPATCGNLSILRTYHPAVARLTPPASRVASSAQHAPTQSAPASIAPPLPAPAQAAAASPASPAPAAASSPPPSASAPPPEAAPTSAPISITPPQPSGGHKLRWPWLIPIVLLFFSGGGSGSSSHPVSGGGGCGCGCH